MRNLFYVLLFFTISSVLGCNDNIRSSSQRGVLGEVSFSLSKGGINTRAGDTFFEEGDEVGIFVYCSSSGKDFEFKNVKFIVQSGKLVPASGSDKIYFYSNWNYDIYAYSPYSESYTNTLIQYSGITDQAELSVYKKIDMVSSRLVDISGSSLSLNLNFEHTLSVLEVRLQKGEGLEVESVFTSAVKYNGFIDLETGEVLNIGENRRTHYMCLYGENDREYIYRAILFPQELTTESYVYFRYKGKNEANCFLFKEPLTLEAGKKHVVNINAQFKTAGFVYPANSGTITGLDVVYNYGDYATMLARPEDGYLFYAWSKYPDYDNIYSTDPYLTFQMTDRIIWRAEMVPEICRLNIKILPDRKYFEDNFLPNQYRFPLPIVYAKSLESISLYAAVNTEVGYRFEGWYEDDRLLMEGFTLSITPLTDRNLEARFRPIAFSLGASKTLMTDVAGDYELVFDNSMVHEVYMEKGERIRQISNISILDINSTGQYEIGLKELTIRNGSTVVLQTLDFENLIFEAPYTGTFSFSYRASVKGNLKSGERVNVTLSIGRNAWYLDRYYK